MDDIRKRVLLDVFVTPTTCIPTVVGLSLLILSRVIPILAFPGFLGVLIGVGVALTNLVFNLDKITREAVQRHREQERRRRERELDALDRKLTRDRDPRDQTYLRDLRAVYGTFCKDIERGRISTHVTQQMLEQIDQIFEAAVHSLEHQWELWEMSTQVRGELKEELERQRNEVIEQVGRSVKELATAVSHVRALRLKARKAELKNLQENLARSLSVARQVEEFTSRVERSADDVLEQYAEYGS